jgi:hypothetical protein
LFSAKVRSGKYKGRESENMRGWLLPPPPPRPPSHHTNAADKKIFHCAAAALDLGVDRYKGRRRRALLSVLSLSLSLSLRIISGIILITRGYKKPTIPDVGALLQQQSESTYLFPHLKNLP